MPPLPPPPQVELVLELARQGWTTAARPPPHMIDGGDLVFDARMFNRAPLYFLALVKRGEIMQRGCDRILHMMPSKYYELLLGKRDISRLHNRNDLRALKASDFAKMCRGIEVPEGGFLALEGPVDEDVMFNLEGGLADIVEEDEHHGIDDADGMAEALPAPEVVAMCEMDLPLYRLDGFVVRWDFFSHNSRQRRGYTKCHAHRDCFRYAQLNKFEGPIACASHLLAWAQAGAELSREVHVSRMFQPDASVVQSNLQRLCGGGASA